MKNYSLAATAAADDDYDGDDGDTTTACANYCELVTFMWVF